MTVPHDAAPSSAGGYTEAPSRAPFTRGLAPSREVLPNGIVLLVAVAWVYYRQALDAPALFGLGLIVAGIAVINLFSKSLPH